MSNLHLASEVALKVRLSQRAQEHLSQWAAARGLSAEQYIGELVERALEAPATFAQVCAPFEEALTASGMTDDQFEALVEQIREEVWEESASNRREQQS